MRIRGLYLLSALYILLLCTARSSAIALMSSGGGEPFEHSLLQGSASHFESTLQFHNDSASEAMVLAWQLELQIQPLANSQGAVLFESVSLPPSSLFGDGSSLACDLTSPAVNLLAFDASIIELFGSPISAFESRNAVTIKFLASADALGSFEVIAPEFDQSQPDLGSSWLADDFLPHAFSNWQPSSVPGFIRLGTITIASPSFEPGDFNRDTVVNLLDYEVWQAHFGQLAAPSGAGADGNQNGVVDAADFVIWRNSSRLAPEQLAVVPEPKLPLLWLPLTLLAFLNTARGRARK